MTRISPLRPVPAGQFEVEGSTGVAETNSSPRRDLVRVEPAEPATSPHLARPRPQAAFLAHLLAVAQRAPQTQEKRRAAPQDASERYAAAGKAVPARPGRTLKRAI